MNTTNDYFEQTSNWQDALNLLREIILETGLNETFKWKTPCYTFEGKNILLLGKFKSHCTLSFFKGVLLPDPHEILISAGPNSKSVKVIHFTETKEIADRKKEISKLIFEAIEIEKSGHKPTPNQEEILIITELQEVFNKDASFENAFKLLSKGRQRGYVIYFENAKQSKTKTDRITKMRDRILKGYGLQDCTCGKSKKMPKCDGSHKIITPQ